jgi:hypothetical protein
LGGVGNEYGSVDAIVIVVELFDHTLVPTLDTEFGHVSWDGYEIPLRVELSALLRRLSLQDDTSCFRSPVSSRIKTKYALAIFGPVSEIRWCWMGPPEV